MAHNAASEPSSKTRRLLSLSLGALGVVYGANDHWPDRTALFNLEARP